MMDWFKTLDPPAQALLAGLFTWAVTGLGAAGVFVHRGLNRRVLDAMLGFSGGVMVAASYWSLLAPAIEIAATGPLPRWLPPLIGFLAGAGCIWLLDKVLPHLHLFLPTARAEGWPTGWKRSILLVLAITLHNIPEGLAIGVAFGGVVAGMPGAGLEAAIALTLGIGLQNFPEGSAVSMPLRGEGMRPAKAFWYGQLSAAVEPPMALLGAVLVGISVAILPYALSFAAGAMIFVVVEELIPESHQAGNIDLATISFISGFALMMTLDVALG